MTATRCRAWEATPDAGGTAAPVFDPAGRVVASVAATAPLSRMTGDDDAARLADAVVAAAREITEALRAFDEPRAASS